MILLVVAFAILLAGALIHHPLGIDPLRSGPGIWAFPAFMAVISAVSIGLAWLWHRSMVEARMEGEQSQLREAQQRDLTRQTLLEREQWYRGLFQGNPLAMLLLDPQSAQIVDANTAASEFYGYTHAQLTSMKITQINVLPEDQVREKMKEISGRGTMRLDFQHRLADGSLRNVHVTSGRIELEGRLMLFSVIRDTTAQLQAEESVRRIVEASPMGFHIYRLEGARLVFCGYNNAAEQILGIEHKQLLGKEISEAFPGEEVEPVAARYREIARSGGTWQFEDFKYADGRLAGAYDVVAFQVSAGHMVATFSDATERHRNQQLLLRAERRFRTLYEHSPVGIASVDLQTGRFRNANAAFLRTYNTTEPELLEKTFEDLLAPDQRRITADLFGNEPRTLELRCVSGASSIWVAVTMCAIPAKDAPLHVGLVVVQDITHRRQSEEQLRDAKTAAERASAAKDQFLAALSHELRTPLTPVLLATQSLQLDDSLPRSARDELVGIQRNIELEARLIDDLLDITRITRGKLQLHLTEMDIHEAINRAADICRADADQKRVRLELWLEAEFATIRADPSRIQQVLWNLIKNAIKFTPDNGLVLIHTRNDRQSEGADDFPQVICEVTDSGIGMSEDVLSRIFRPFEQGSDQITRLFGGLGMGLVISKAIIDLHHGRIDAYSAGPEKGSVFSVYLQSVRPSAQEPPRRRPLVSGERRAMTVLLVEDHEPTARIMSQLLARCGYAVICADDVASARRVIDTRPFDLLLSDLGLPDGSGIDVVEHLKQGRKVPAIALSGYGMDRDIQQSLEAGFCTHLVKPVDIHRLQEAIDSALGAPV